MENIDEQIDLLKTQIADLRARLPAHSVKPAMLIELEELEEKLEYFLQSKTSG